MSEFALDGLKQVMTIKSRVVLPYLVPKVTPTRSHSCIIVSRPAVEIRAELRYWGRWVVGAGCPGADTEP